MSADTVPSISEAMPSEVWDILLNDKNAVLVDVRTQSEWAFVGTPDLSSLDQDLLCVEWAEYPNMVQNPNFVTTVFESLVRQEPSQIFFLCRSGVRSLSAARAVATAMTGHVFSCPCVNVLEGFEGDLDREQKRGGLNGWKARGLPWGQS
jgi:rhodanese-related sulfurtransferase